MLQNTSPNFRVTAGLATAAVVFSIVAFMFAFTGAQSPCASAQSAQCSIGDDEVIAGSLTLEDELNVGATPGPGTSNQYLASQGASTVPEWTDLPVDGFITIQKTGDTSTANDAVLSDDPHLVFSGVANAEYAIQGNLIFTESSNTSGHWAVVRINVPSGFSNFVAVTDTGTSSITLPVNSGTDTISIDCNAVASVNTSCSITGSVSISGTPGNVAIEWAQNSSQSNTLTLKQESWISYQRLD